MALTSISCHAHLETLAVSLHFITIASSTTPPIALHHYGAFAVLWHGEWISNFIDFFYTLNYSNRDKFHAFLPLLNCLLTIAINYDSHRYLLGATVIRNEYVLKPRAFLPATVFLPRVVTYYVEVLSWTKCLVDVAWQDHDGYRIA